MDSKYNSANLYFKSFDMCNENFFTLKFVDYVVHKVLFDSLRKKKQLVYAVNCNSYGHKDIGITEIKFSSTHKELSDVINIIFIELDENVINITTKDYLNIKKSFINISKHSILKDPSHAINFEKLNLFMKRRVHFEEYIEHIKNFNRDTFSELCKNILNRSNISISATYNDNNDQYHIDNITKIVQNKI
jgi:secreted Zn-dependent insulinase-like peptidase